MPLEALGKLLQHFFIIYEESQLTNNPNYRHTLIPPRGYSIAGIYGSCGPWIDGFGLIITR